MHLIRTSAAIEAIYQTLDDPELHTLLGAYAAALEEFGDTLLADILIVEAGDTLAAVEAAYGKRLVADGRFAFPVELIDEHARFYEVVWIVSDFGEGLLLLVDKAGESLLRHQGLHKENCRHPAKGCWAGC